MPWVTTWSPAERATLLRMRAAGRTWREVGIALGRRPEGCRFFARTTLGLGGDAEPLPRGRRRPTAGEFALAHLHGAEGRGWSDFLEDGEAP